MSFLQKAYRPFQWMKRLPGHPLRVFSAALKTLLVGHVFLEFGYGIARLQGASMLPTFEVLGDWTIISKQFRRGRGIEVGDVVAFASVVEPGEEVVKRVLALEGDYVLRNTPDTGSDEMLQVPRGHCWVVGDNLEYSRDSRHFGPLPMGLIRGKVVAKVFPWSERRWISNGVQPVSKLEAS